MIHSHPKDGNFTFDTDDFEVVAYVFDCFSSPRFSATCSRTLHNEERGREGEIERCIFKISRLVG